MWRASGAGLRGGNLELAGDIPGVPRAGLFSPEALLESSARLNAVLWVLDVSSQITVHVSRGFEEVFGRGPGWLLRCPGTWADYVHEADRERVRATRAAGKDFDLEYRIVRPDGELRWVRDRTILRRGDENRLDQLVGIVEDITLARQARNRLRSMLSEASALQGRAFLRALVRGIAEDLDVEVVAILEKPATSPDILRNIARWSRGTEHSENLPLAGDPCAEVAAGARRTYARNLTLYFPDCDRVAAIGAEAFIGVPLTSSDGQVVGVIEVLSSRPIEAADFVQYALHSFGQQAAQELLRAVSEERERERVNELAHASRLGTMSHMAVGIAHEINQPLAAIVNYASGIRHKLLALGVDDAELHEAVQSASLQAQRAGEIIRRMRAFLKKGASERSPERLQAIVERALERRT